MKREIKDFKEAYDFLTRRMDRWNGRGSVYTMVAREAKKLSRDPVFNAAAYLYWDLRVCGNLKLLDNSDWINMVGAVQKILGGKP